MKVPECSAQLVQLIKDAQIPVLLTVQPADGELPNWSRQKVVAIDVAEQMMERLGSSLVRRPAIGVMYEGGRATGTQQIGLTAELVFSLFILTEQNVIAPELLHVTTDTQVLIDAVKAAIQGVKSPTGHKWSWVLEAPAAKKGALLLWVQRWKTACVLNPR